MKEMKEMKGMKEMKEIQEMKEMKEHLPTYTCFKTLWAHYVRWDTSWGQAKEEKRGQEQGQGHRAGAGAGAGAVTCVLSFSNCSTFASFEQQVLHYLGAGEEGIPEGAGAGAVTYM